MIQALLAKYGIILLSAVLFAVMNMAIGNHYGRVHVQALWDADKAATAIAANEAIMARLAENRAKESERAQELQKTKESYETQITDLGKRPVSRLYIPKAAACYSAAVPTGATDTGSADDPPGSVGLPTRIEENLYALIDKADVIRIRLTALQEACK